VLRADAPRKLVLAEFCGDDILSQATSGALSRTNVVSRSRGRIVVYISTRFGFLLSAFSSFFCLRIVSLARGRPAEGEGRYPNPKGRGATLGGGGVAVCVKGSTSVSYSSPLVQ